MLFCSGCVEGFLASEVILGQRLCGNVCLKAYIVLASYRVTRLTHLSLGPRVFRGPRNFAPSRGIWVFPRFLNRGILPQNSFLFRGMRRNLTFFIRTTIFSQKMTSK